MISPYPYLLKNYKWDINMGNITDTIIETTLEEINVKKFPIDEVFELKVTYNNVLFEFLIELKSSSDKILFLGSGLFVENEKNFKLFHNKPVYQRFSWEFEESTIYYNDPTRYVKSSNDYHDDLRGGFCIGTPDDWYLADIKTIILTITKQLNIENSNLLFYGSSMGGFSSAMLGTMIKDSKVLADIPITDLYKTKYSRYLINYLYGDISLEKLQEFDYRFKIIEFIKREQYVPNMLIVFTAYDVDIKNQCIPIIKEFKELPYLKNNHHRIKIVFNPVCDHSPLHESYVNYYINLMFFNDLDSSDVKDVLTLDKYLKGNDTARDLLSQPLINEYYSTIIQYVTARIDIKSYGFNDNIKILSSDDTNSFSSYSDNQDKETNVVIESTMGFIELKIQSTKKSLLEVDVKGPFFTDKNMNRIPVYIDITQLEINSENIIDKNKVVSYDDTIKYTKEVQDNEITSIKLKWRPFNSNSVLEDNPSVIDKIYNQLKK